MKLLTKTSFLILIQTLLWLTASWAAPLIETNSVSLNGEWQMGNNRHLEFLEAQIYFFNGSIVAALLSQEAHQVAFHGRVDC